MEPELYEDKSASGVLIGFANASLPEWGDKPSGTSSSAGIVQPKENLLQGSFVEIEVVSFSLRPACRVWEGHCFHTVLYTLAVGSWRKYGVAMHP
jgi:hypothetical protein